MRVFTNRISTKLTVKEPEQMSASESQEVDEGETSAKAK